MGCFIAIALCVIKYFSCFGICYGIAISILVGIIAELFPDLAADLLAINERVIDQLIPFRSRALYSYKQKSSASIKYVLPAFSDLSYKGMNIANGGEAMSKYLAFLEGSQSEEESKQMFADLLKYCGQDTYAMVLLMKVLYQFANGEK